MRRRSYLRTGGIALGTIVTAGLSGCSTADSAGGTPLDDQLSKIESATSDYADPKAALDDGFKAGGPYVPGMGWHFSHPKRGKEAAQNGIDIEKPNILTYLETEDGLQLGAVEYGVPEPAVEETPDVFDDEDADATETWHGHDAATHVFALPDDAQTPPKKLTFEQLTTKEHWAEFHPPDENLAAGDTVSLNWGTAKGKRGDRTERVADIVNTHPTLKTLHVWVHTENPDGTFAPMNPEYTNGGGHHDGTETGHDH